MSQCTSTVSSTLPYRNKCLISGLAEPMIIVSPEQDTRRNQTSNAMVSLLDLVPTILDWFKVPYPNYTLPDFKTPVRLSGRSLLPLLVSNPEEGQHLTQWNRVFGSHSLHEATMYYPMRTIRTKQYKLIRNLNFQAPFPIDQDFYLSPTFQDILNKTASGMATHWYKSLKDYYQRPEWELYDLQNDPFELTNLANDTAHSDVLQSLQAELEQWQWDTNDPWVCSPNGVLEPDPETRQPVCMPLYNNI